MGSQSTKQKAAENYYLLQNYRIDDVQKPKVILRKLFNENSDDLNQDDLFVITLDMQNPNENIQKMLPADFAWALNGLKKFKDSYQKILADQTERVHLEGIAKQNSYLMIENIAPKENSNANDSSAYAGGCAELNGRPCIMLVADKIKGTTLLHESVHHSDLMLGGRPFSDLPIYQTIIMINMFLKGFTFWNSIRFHRSHAVLPPRLIESISIFYAKQIFLPKKKVTSQKLRFQAVPHTLYPTISSVMRFLPLTGHTGDF